MKNFVDIEIDFLTESVVEAATGIIHETYITSVSQVLIKSIHKKSGWSFNWRKEFKSTGRKIFMLTLKNDLSNLLGLISLEVMEDHVHVHLVESSPDNLGAQKKFLGIGGNLFAFACKTSFDNGFCGNIAFISKTNLIQHYSLTLGAVYIGNYRMIIRENEAIFLISKYYASDKRY
ncbi:MAG: hypothetical protein ACK4YD_07320 [Chitinophagia bacterium]|jgi:hypothetical protein